MLLENEAINIVLSALGEPLLGVTDTGEQENYKGIFEAEQAYFLLEQVRKEVLAEGWNLNTDTGIIIAPDENGYITIEDVALKIDSTDGYNYIYRSGKLYDKDNLTFIFENSVDLDIVWDIEFNSLSFSLQRYIALRAARILSQRLDADLQNIQLLMKDEQDAYSKLKEEEFESGDYSIFDDDGVYRVIDRTTNPTKVR